MNTIRQKGCHIYHGILNMHRHAHVPSRILILQRSRLAANVFSMSPRLSSINIRYRHINTARKGCSQQEDPEQKKRTEQARSGTQKDQTLHLISSLSCFPSSLPALLRDVKTPPESHHFPWSPPLLFHRILSHWWDITPVAVHLLIRHLCHLDFFFFFFRMPLEILPV